MPKPIPVNRASVPRLWPGETVACIASGPSLTAEDVNALRGRAKTIVINASYAMAPWADVIYCADAGPFKWYWNRGPKGYERIAMKDCPGVKYSLTSSKLPAVQVLRRGREEGLSLDPKALCLGKNSGYQAINLAVLLGAKRILLLGYDMNTRSKQEYWHEPHPYTKRSPYKNFRRFFGTIVQPLKAAGVEVINCSRETALEAFPRRPLADVLPTLVESAA